MNLTAYRNFQMAAVSERAPEQKTRKKRKQLIPYSFILPPFRRLIISRLPYSSQDEDDDTPHTKMDAVFCTPVRKKRERTYANYSDTEKVPEGYQSLEAATAYNGRVLMKKPKRGFLL